MTLPLARVLVVGFTVDVEERLRTLLEEGPARYELTIVTFGPDGGLDPTTRDLLAEDAFDALVLAAERPDEARPRVRALHTAHPNLPVVVLLGEVGAEECEDAARTWDGVKRLLKRDGARDVILASRITCGGSCVLPSVLSHLVENRRLVRELEKARNGLAGYENLVLAGRTGMFWYNNMDHSIENAMQLCRRLLRDAGNQEISEQLLAAGQAKAS